MSDLDDFIFSKSRSELDKSDYIELDCYFLVSMNIPDWQDSEMDDGWSINTPQNIKDNYENPNFYNYDEIFSKMPNFKFPIIKTDKVQIIPNNTIEHSCYDTEDALTFEVKILLYK